MTPRRFAYIGMVFIATIGRAAETTDLPARYQAIIARSPFGQVQGASNDAPPNWLANYVFTALIRSNSGDGVVQAIISTKDNAHWYFRAEGETVDANITVQKIDVSQKQPKLVLKNGLETGTLTFPERTAVAAAAPSTPPAIGNPPPGAAPGAVPPTVRRIPFRRGN